jgi:hypothetical protein
MKRLSFIIFLLGVTLLAACAPARGTGPESDLVALINGPTEERLPELADQLEAQLRTLPACCAFSFQWSVPVRAQERQRDMFGVRAPLQAAYLARNLGDRWAVLVGTTGFDRTVEETADRYFISGTLAVQAVVIDPSDASVLATVTSAAFSGSRIQGKLTALPGEREDPLMLELARQALADLAPQLLSVLNGLATQ